MADPVVVAVAVIPVESKAADGSITYHQFEPGEVVKGHGVTKELIETLRASGSVAEPPATLPDVVAEKEALEARVADLTKQLEDAKATKADAEKGGAKADAVAAKATYPAKA